MTSDKTNWERVGNYTERNMGRSETIPRANGE
jgi:hypothetical protein